MSAFLQRIAIGAGALIVVVLTVMVAVFLTMQDLPQDDGPTPAAQVSPTPVRAATPARSPTPSPTLRRPAPIDTPTASPTPLPPVEPRPTSTPVPPTATATPEPRPPTPTPLPALPTATPTPAVLTNCGQPPPPGWVAYIVQAGDTFNSLARRTDVSVFDLQGANCLRTIRPGDRLFLPYYPPPPTPTGTRNPTRRPGPTPTRTPTPINPYIIAVAPDAVDEQTSTQEIIISVFGGNFRSREVGFRAELRGPQSPLLQLQGDGTDTNFTAIVPANLPVGIYDLVVTNPNNRAGMKPAALIIGQVPPGPLPVPKPFIIAVEPESGFNNQERTIEIRGFNFRPNLPGFLVELRIGSTFIAELERVGQAWPTSVTVIVPAGLAAEVYDVWVINPGGQEDVAPAAYQSLQF